MVAGQQILFKEKGGDGESPPHLPMKNPEQPIFLGLYHKSIPLFEELLPQNEGLITNIIQSYKKRVEDLVIFVDNIEISFDVLNIKHLLCEKKNESWEQSQTKDSSSW